MRFVEARGDNRFSHAVGENLFRTLLLRQIVGFYLLDSLMFYASWQREKGKRIAIEDATSHLGDLL